MKKIIGIALLALTIGCVFGCQRKEESEAEKEHASAATQEAVSHGNTEEPVHTEDIEQLVGTEEPASTANTEKSGSKNLTEPKQEASEQKGQEAAEGSKSDTNNMATDKPKAASQERAQSYYGTWKVTQYCASYITAITSEEMEALIGAECEYEADYFISDKTRLDMPKYSESTETEQEFGEANQERITFQTFGITADTVKQIYIENSYDFGSIFYVKDENTIIIMYEGVFFEAVRQ